MCAVDVTHFDKIYQKCFYFLWPDMSKHRKRGNSSARYSNNYSCIFHSYRYFSFISRSLVRSLVRFVSFVGSFIYLFVRSFVLLFVSSFVRSFARFFVPSFPFSFPSFSLSFSPSFRFVRLFLRSFRSFFLFLVSSFVRFIVPSFAHPFLSLSLSFSPSLAYIIFGSFCRPLREEGLWTLFPLQSNWFHHYWVRVSKNEWLSTQ